MDISVDSKTGSKPVMESNSRIILAADAALAAINEHFSDEFVKGEWANYAALRRAALRTALASLI
ncbi:hypothetical protein ACHEUP_06920 [Enterobacter cloacae]|uniref:hypothetical protein n=1 Tax=Enterobacter cloacae TaxID=550 RepID=UPI0027ED8577|nr:hypothetical protein [Enterobacter cloacae]HDT4051171.1 hypothetical protein [Enterobacter bugandensis]